MILTDTDRERACAKIASQFRAKLPPSVEFDDLMQEARIGWETGLRRFDPARSNMKPRNLAYAYAYHAVQTHLRDYAGCGVRAQKVKATANIDRPAAIHDRRPGPEWCATRCGARAAIGKAIGMLNPNERAVITFCYLQGIGRRRVAKLMQMSFQRVYQIEHRALTKLRAILSPGAVYL